MNSADSPSGANASAARIEPRTLKGFRDYLPEAMIPRERLIDTARRVYRSYGFSPIDTPALEYLDILTGKGSDETDKQLYKFQDHGERWVGLRFDLTVPLARFAAQHIGTLGTPFKRYHIASVWRGENTQRGRYREFMQCDFDTLGTESPVADIETALVIHDLMRAIGFEQFTLRINHRQVLNGLLERHGLAEQSVAILRAIDKRYKIGVDGVVRELVDQVGTSHAAATAIMEMVGFEGDNQAVLAQLAASVGDNPRGEQGVAALADLISAVAAAGVAPERIRLDPSIARGLDYYTGTIYETFLDALPGIGSVCSGGRYDNLAGTFTKQHLPGVGASLGLDRLLAAMEELGLVSKVTTTAPVLVVFFDAAQRNTYLQLSARLRTAGIGAELYPEPKRLGQQLKYADRRGFRLALIAGENELAAGRCQLKDLQSGTSYEVPLAPEHLLGEQAAALLAEQG